MPVNTSDNPPRKALSRDYADTAEVKIHLVKYTQNNTQYGIRNIQSLLFILVIFV